MTSRIRQMRADPVGSQPPWGATLRLMTTPVKWIAALAIAAVALVQAVALADDAETRIQGVTYVGDLPTYVADTQGFFAAEAGDVTVTYGGSGKENLQRVRAGDIDFALMAMTPLVIDALADPTPAGKDDPVILANLSHSRPVVNLLHLDGGKEPGEATLRGKTVGVPFGTNAHYVLHVIATVQGLGPGDFTAVDMEPSDLSDALAEGRIDTAIVWDPWAQLIRERFGPRLTSVADTGHYVSRWMLVARRDTVNGAPEKTEAVLRAYRRAVDWIQKNPQAALDAHYARWSNVAPPPDDLKPVPLFDVTLDWSLISSYRQQLAWARDRGWPVVGDVPSFVDMVAPQPLESLAPEAVLLPRMPAAAEGEER